MKLHVEARTFTYHEGATTLTAAEVDQWRRSDDDERVEFLDELAHAIVYDNDHAGHTEIETLDWRIDEGDQ